MIEACRSLAPTRERFVRLSRPSSPIRAGSVQPPCAEFAVASQGRNRRKVFPFESLITTETGKEFTRSVGILGWLGKKKRDGLTNSLLAYQRDGRLRFKKRQRQLRAFQGVGQDGGGSEATFKRLQSTGDLLEMHVKAAVNRQPLHEGEFLNCEPIPPEIGFSTMGEERNRRGRYGRREPQEFKAGFAVPEFPATSKIGIKQIAFLHWYCRLQPHLIAARYPNVLTLADIHLALAHYFRNPEPIDAEIKRELAFNTRDGLNSPTMSLPRVDEEVGS